MDFKLNEEQQLMRDMFREYAQKELKAIAAKLDEEEHFPIELIPQMAEIGLLGITVPDDFGGLGLGAFENAMAIEELSKVCASTGATICMHSACCCDSIVAFGTDEQKEAYLSLIHISPAHDLRCAAGFLFQQNRHFGLHGPGSDPGKMCIRDRLRCCCG